MSFRGARSVRSFVDRKRHINKVEVNDSVFPVRLCFSRTGGGTYIDSLPPGRLSRGGAALDVRFSRLHRS